MYYSIKKLSVPLFQSRFVRFNNVRLNNEGSPAHLTPVTDRIPHHHSPLSTQQNTASEINVNFQAILKVVSSYDSVSHIIVQCDWSTESGNLSISYLSARQLIVSLSVMHRSMKQPIIRAFFST